MSYTVTFTNSNGAAVDFDAHGQGYVLRGPIEQTHMPPVRHTVRPVFGQPGGIRTHTRLLEREVVVPLAVMGTPGSVLESRMRGLASLLDPQIGDGTLRVQRDITDRILTCRYQDGFDGRLRAADWGPTEWWEGEVTFVAFDPYWTDTDDITAAWSNSGGILPFFDVPFLPFDRMLAGDAFATLDVEVTGDQGAWPVWRIVGPADNAVITNTTTDEVLDFTDIGGLSILADQSVLIDTRPGIKTVTLQDFTFGEWVDNENVLAYLTDASSLFDLRVGVNLISFSVDNPSGATGLQVSYRQRYLSP